MTEPTKEQIIKTKLKAVAATVETLNPQLDPVNRPTLVEWARSNMERLRAEADALVDEIGC